MIPRSGSRHDWQRSAVAGRCAARPPRRAGPPGGPANTVDIGVIAGAPYYIEIPVKWNKGLVLYTHGYTPEGRQAAAVHVAATQGIS